MSRWSFGHFALGLNLGAAWGSTELRSDGVVAGKYEPYAKHFLAGGQLGYRGPRVATGFRLAANRASYELEDVADTTRVFLRAGPYLAVNVATWEVRRLDIALYVEGALYIDTLLLIQEVATQEAKFHRKDTYLSLVPSFGVGSDIAVVAGLRVGIYTGLMLHKMALSYAAWDHSVINAWELPSAGFFVGGEFRLTVLWAFGEGRRL